MENRWIETSQEVCYFEFCNHEWVGHNVCNLCRNRGPYKLKKIWLTLKTLDMEVMVDLYGFVFFFFFFVDRTQKIKIKKWFQKLLLTPWPGTHSNPLIILQDLEDRRPWTMTHTTTHTIQSGNLNSMYYITGCLRIKSIKSAFLFEGPGFFSLLSLLLNKNLARVLVFLLTKVISKYPLEKASYLATILGPGVTSLQGTTWDLCSRL